MFGTGYQYRNPFNWGSFYVFGLPDAIAEANKPAPTTAAPPAATSGTAAPKKKGAAGKLSVTLPALYSLALLAISLMW
jgi:hypothetical protein